MNAGHSEAGFDLACRRADWVFVVPPKGRLGDYAELVERAHDTAVKHGRRVRVGAMCYWVMEDTVAQAARTFQQCLCNQQLTGLHM